MVCSIQLALLGMATAPLAALAQSSDNSQTQTLDAITVTGSRIPRAQIEGPAPITVVTAEQIKAAGLTSVPDVLRAMSQNNGYTLGVQNTSAAQVTPGAQQVDLRGLGPGHTLVLINGRRVADFPLPMSALDRGSGFTDIGNIPLGMIERVEVLTGSASAIYGSDAMAGVINFILKKHADGTTIDYRYGDTEHGGGDSHNLTLTTGVDSGNFSGVVGLELIYQKPLWGYQRKQQDSSLDAPVTGRTPYPNIVARIDDEDTNGQDIDCSGLTGLNGGTTALTEDRFGDPYCGSNNVIAQRTILNERKGAMAYGSFEYRFNDKLSWFADVQGGRQTVKLMTGNGGPFAVSDNMGWQFYDPSSTDAVSGIFDNAATGQNEIWYRQFSPEEVGSLQNRMNVTVETTVAITTGFKGVFGNDWDWEAAFNHSQYKADVKMPRIIASAANQFFLGDVQGYDADGYAIYSPDPARLTTPLTPAEFDSISAMSVFHPEAKDDNLSFTVDTTSLFSMPAGDVGFAGVLEFGRQSYDLDPDPLATTDYYYGPKYGNGSGSRNHWDAGAELRLPLASTLNASLAGRYDRYNFAGKSPSKFTYNAGLEWRPVESLLLRGSYATGFRAPDLQRVFASEDFYRSISTDYYHCRTDEPDYSNNDCFDDGSWDTLSKYDVYVGNRDLKPETSRSFTGGFVWSPVANFDLSVDYYDIRIKNRVDVQSRDQLLITDGACRLGVTDTGQPVDINSPTCVDAMSRVIRDADGNITSVHFQAVNIARENTSGIDVSANYRLQTAAAGDFAFTGNYTWARRHTEQLLPGDAYVDMLSLNYVDTAQPRVKSNLGVTWSKDQWGVSLFGTYLGRVANFGNDAWTQATWRANGAVRYDITDHLRVSLSIDNLFDKMPPKDAEWTSYPYYNTSWFDTVGRTYYLDITWKLGGEKL